jgi:hypothetical protein
VGFEPTIPFFEQVKTVDALDCSDTVIGGSQYRCNKNTLTLDDVSEEVDLEVNEEKTMYMLMSRHQNAGQNHDIKIANRFFENDAQFCCLKT